MPAVPAFCDTCGTVFSSGIFVEDSMHISLSGNKAGPCPRCGGMGHVPDGVFNFIGNTIEILSAPERTVSELIGLAKILQEARRKGEDKEEVTARIEKELPSLSTLAKLLPTNKSELYGFLGVVIAAVSLYTQSPEKPPSQTIVNVTQIVQQVTNEQPPNPSQMQPSPSGRKQGRNEACQCGSGKKYKKCCGVLK
ncbi:SEC-C metal-binding domain-containing protein [Hydrogenophaga sp.]|uniref:SEC-C metal-binding domain-containing protein n=1 Tax=Hydrogenophaga sp. TaxID=1904254 RepID=UPI002624A7AE|nr:SEC-C metal-binding domain-containing protein [Hydrogenophaga sp.]MDM7948968.1 SEC-C metal-binding domain-containing protein [Hydrogenophaga sp.]